LIPELLELNEMRGRHPLCCDFATEVRFCLSEEAGTEYCEPLEVWPIGVCKIALMNRFMGGDWSSEFEWDDEDYLRPLFDCLITIRPDAEYQV
jgi:hypothetical protein